MKLRDIRTCNVGQKKATVALKDVLLAYEKTLLPRPYNRGLKKVAMSTVRKVRDDFSWYSLGCMTVHEKKPGVYQLVDFHSRLRGCLERLAQNKFTPKDLQQNVDVTIVPTSQATDVYKGLNGGAKQTLGDNLGTVDTYALAAKISDVRNSAGCPGVTFFKEGLNIQFAEALFVFSEQPQGRLYLGAMHEARTLPNKYGTVPLSEVASLGITPAATLEVIAVLKDLIKCQKEVARLSGKNKKGAIAAKLFSQKGFVAVLMLILANARRKEFFTDNIRTPEQLARVLVARAEELDRHAGHLLSSTYKDVIVSVTTILGKYQK